MYYCAKIHMDKNESVIYYEITMKSISKENHKIAKE